MTKDVKKTEIPRGRIEIDDLVLKTDKDEKVAKVYFTTDIGKMSWRANTDRGYKEQDGFKIEKKIRQKPGLDELPKIIYDINEQLKVSKPVAVEAAYRQWDYGNNKVGYSFGDDNIRDMSLIATGEKSRKKK
ncbi:MAG: hypothetical protein PHH61_00050 [Candidatus Nanoarchaeia archaeon]|nr:hypothetical protein [Candidatus Nanoarchaeia archaeon]